MSIFNQKGIMKGIISMIALVMVFTSFIPLADAANKSGQAEETDLSVVEDNLEKIESGDFQEVMPSVHKMNENQKKLFNQLIEEQSQNQDNPELFKKVLTDFFNEPSGHAYEMDYAINKLESEQSLQNIESVRTMEVQPMALAWKGIGVNFAGAALNTALGFAVGGGVGAIQAFIAKKGKKEAAKLFTRTVTSRLKAWGFTKLALSANAAVQFALNYSDVGGQLARYLDSIDSKPNNGWINGF